jgi:tetratricopeptide (TPR) repeat protein
MDRDKLSASVEEMLPRLGEDTFYELLSIDPKASTKKIREAFHALALIFHVDAYSGEDLGDLREPMEQIFGDISRAQTCLTDTEDRANYDASLSLAARGVPTDVRAIFQADEAFRSGKRLVERGNFEAACERLEQSCELNPSEPDHWSYLYWARFGALPTDEEGKPEVMSKVRDITDSLILIVEENEMCESARVFLANIYRVDGEADKAKRMYKAALRLNPSNFEAASAIRVLNMRKQKATQSKSFFARLFKLS